MGEDNLTKLSEIVALVSLYLEPKRLWVWCENEGCHTLLSKIGDFPEKRVWQPSFLHHAHVLLDLSSLVRWL